MIAANKRLLKATLTEGVLSIQARLISLYSGNLAMMGTEAAVVSVFAFGAKSVSYTRYVRVCALLY